MGNETKLVKLENNHYTYYDYLSKVYGIKKEMPSVRLGHIAFNLLYNRNNKLALSIKGTNLDPFFENDLSQEFLNHIQEKWEPNIKKMRECYVINS